MADFDIVIENTWTHLKPNIRLNTDLVRRIEHEMSYSREEYSRFRKETIELDISLFEREQLRYPTGLYSTLESVLNDCRLTFNVIDARNVPIIGEPLKMHSKQLRDYQEEVVEKSIEAERGVIKVATGGGKTVIAAAIVARLNLKTLFIVYSIDLLEQTADEFEKMFQIKVGKIGGGHCDIKQINICTVQTLHSAFDLKYSAIDEENMFKEKIQKHVLERKEDIRKAVLEADVVINDECFQAETHVHISLDEYMYIKDICENDAITHVLSYNHEKQIFEQKRILRRFITQVSEPWCIITFVFKGKEKLIFCTSSHKFWTKNRGYVQAKDLLESDVLKINANKSRPRFYCEKHKCLHRERVHRKKIKLSEQSKLKHFKVHSSLMSKMNKNPIIRERMRLGWLKNFENKTEEEKAIVRERFMNAPKRIKGKEIKPTRLEQAILDLKIPEIRYTGNGKFWLRIGTKPDGKCWSKNPDFKIKNQRKVIEVGNITFWHTKEEIERVKKGFESIGFKCLYLTNEDIEENWEETKLKINTFIFNHDEALVKSVRMQKKIKDEKKYNIEVEDNHNYFAEGILVSNCHRATAEIYIQMAKLYQNAYYRFSLSATPYRDKSIDKVLDAYSGRQICNIDASFLIERGFLVQPHIYMLDPNEHPRYKYVQKSFRNIYEDYIVNNKLRNEMIVDSCLRLLELGKSVLITVTRLPHGDVLCEMLDKAGVNSVAFIQGEVDGEMRKDLLNKVRKKQLQVLVGSSVADEGVDIPALGSAIMAGGGKSLIKSLQRVGRTLRPYPSAENNEKKEAIIVDFYDRIRYLTGHSKKRLKIYELEPLFKVKRHF